MDVTVIVSEVEAALSGQLGLVGDDPALVRAGEAMLAALQPAIERAALHLAEQAAQEVDAQLPTKRVSVRLQEGTPVLVVEEDDDRVSVDTDALEARITLRLSEQLKGIIEEIAGEAGDSVNSYLVKTLTNKTKDRMPGRRYTGTIET